MIVDDNDGDRRLLTEILRSSFKDCQIMAVSSGRNALEQIQQEAPDLILLDIYMEDKNGFEVLQELREKENGSIPVLLVSSFSNEEDKLKGLQLGAMDFINKPIVAEDVKARVAVQLKLKKIMDDSSWACRKTNDGIKLLYKELERKNEKLKELDDLKDEFVNNVSHELRTPLMIIRESIAQVSDGLFGQVLEKQKKYLNKSLVNIDRLEIIISNLLDVSKIEKGKMDLFKEKINMVKLLEDVISNFEPKVKAKGLELKYKLSSQELFTFADPEKVIQVFTNLIGNALKFTEQGQITVTIDERVDFVECRIGDTGKGIIQRDLQKLFNKFEQLGRQHGPGEKGTGLGLAISKGIVELHGGNITVESEEGKGSTFIFTLPKYSFKEGLTELLISTIKQFNEFSIIKLVIDGQEKQSKIETNRFKDLIAGCLYRKLDQAVEEGGTIYVLLPGTKKENCCIVVERIRQEFIKNNYEVQLGVQMISYPEDGLTEDELIIKLEGVKENV